MAHQKGGVGKSTLALNLVLCFKDQLRIALIDADLQGSLFHIKEEFPEFDILAPEKISKIPNLDYDLIIVAENHGSSQPLPDQPRKMPC